MLRIALIIPRFHWMSSKVRIRRGVAPHAGFPSPGPLAADGVVHHTTGPTPELGVAGTKASLDLLSPHSGRPRTCLACGQALGRGSASALCTNTLVACPSRWNRPFAHSRGAFRNTSR
jgi:hypothetical protein